MNDRLTDLLRDAVSDVEPADRLAEIRARTAETPSRRSARRPWWYVGGASVVAAAAAVAVVALVGDWSAERGPDIGPAPATERPSPSPVLGEVVAAYYAGATPRGERLFREFDRVAEDSPLADAVAVLQTPPSDPDYHTMWPAGSLIRAGVDGVGDAGEISLVVDPAYRDRPTGMTADEADLAIQQAVYTLQAALGDRPPVRFYYETGPADQLLGVPLDGPVANASPTSVLNLISISDPAEGNAYDEAFTARGVANSFEGNVRWEIRSGSRVVKHGFTTAAGCCGDRLYPWEARVNLIGLAPGTYTFVASTDDPSGGGEGHGPDADTRTIVVR